MSFHGTLVEPPCSINSGKVINVVFGNDLGVNKIDGINYKQDINYTVTCDGGYTPSQLELVIDTTYQADFEASAIQTDKEGLGIQILVDGQPVDFAKPLAFNPSALPKLEAVPVQRLGAVLTEGAFSATMTLRTDYQ